MEPKKPKKPRKPRTKKVQEASVDTPVATPAAPEAPVAEVPTVAEVAPQVYPKWVSTESEIRMHDDFRLFVWMLWMHLGLPRPTRRQLKIAEYLANGPRRRMVQAFRGVGKSWLTAAYVLWRLYRNPEEKILVISANEQRAIEFATFVRRLIAEVPELQFLKPRDGQRDSVLAFDVGPCRAAQSPSVKAAGITGQITGSRATLIVPDDIEVPKNSYTETMREKLATLVTEFDAVLVPGGEIVYLGTPQTEQSIYNAIRGRGYDCRIWPARYPTGEQAIRYGGALAPDIVEELQAKPGLVGHTAEPERFTDIDLSEREASYGRSGFALQFMLDTTLSDAERYPLKVADLIVMDVDSTVAPVKVTWTSDPRNAWADIPNLGFTGDRAYRPMYVSPEVAPYTGAVMVIDPSGRGQDETGVVVLKELHALLYLTAVKGFRDGFSPATLEAIVRLAAAQKVRHVLIESNFGDGMFQALIDPVFARLYPCTTEEVRASGQKEKRIIDDTEPVLNQHRLVVDAGILRNEANIDDVKYSLAYQMTHLTADRGSLRHDDKLDALAHGLRYFRMALSRDVEQAEERHLRKQKEKMIDASLEGNLVNFGRDDYLLHITSPRKVTQRKQGVLPKRGRVR